MESVTDWTQCEYVYICNCHPGFIAQMLKPSKKVEDGEEDLLQHILYLTFLAQALGQEGAQQARGMLQQLRIRSPVTRIRGAHQSCIIRIISSHAKGSIPIVRSRLGGAITAQ